MTGPMKLQMSPVRIDSQQLTKREGNDFQVTKNSLYIFWEKGNS